MPQDVTIRWNGAIAGAKARAGAITGLGTAAEHLLTQSRILVPLEEGTLERSGVAQVDDTTLTGAVSYDTPYAVRQHEELTWQHAPGRTAKYLEWPALDEADTIRDLIAASIRRALR